MMLVATAVAASETLAMVSFLTGSLCKNLMCLFPHLPTLHVLLLQSFDM